MTIEKPKMKWYVITTIEIYRKSHLLKTKGDTICSISIHIIDLKHLAKSKFTIYTHIKFNSYKNHYNICTKIFTFITNS